MLKSVFVATTQPNEWYVLFKSLADKSGKSLSEWMGDACIEKAILESRMTKDEADRILSVRKKPGRPKKQTEGTSS